MSDLINRQDAIDAIEAQKANEYGDYMVYNVAFNDGLRHAVFAIKDFPSAQKEIIYCKDCRWWDKEVEDSRMGYCHACKHGHYSRHWEIRIIRTYEENFFCADAEPKEEGEENE